MDRIIVLNHDYSFLNVVSAEKVFSYIAKGKVIVEKYTEKVLTTFEKPFKIPLIVRFTYLIRQIYKKKVPWSKRNVCIRDDYTCAYCGIKNKKMTVDHVIPKILGGKNTFENCVAACKFCNNKKNDRLPKDCGMYPSHKMIQPTITEFMKLWHKSLDVDKIIETLWK